MNNATWLGVLLVVLGGAPVLAADPPKPAERQTLDIGWQWEGDSLPPVLKITVANRGKKPVNLSQWQLAGKTAADFALAGAKTPPAAKVEPGRSADVRLVWNRPKPPDKTFDAAIQFAHDAADAKSPCLIDLRGPAAHLPCKYRLDGFLARQGKPVPRDSNGRIVTNDGYHDGPMIEKLLAAFAEDFPHIMELEEIGKTCQGRKILALRISAGGARCDRDKPAVLFVAAHHASELLGTEIVLDLVGQLADGYATDPEIRRWVNQYDIWCVPLANPDGLHDFFHVNAAGRKNGRDTNANGRIDPTDGVDLNRNYPFRWHSIDDRGSSGQPAHGRYRGPKPASEPETQALMRLADRERFIMLVTYHASGSRVLVPYTTDGARNPHPDTPWIIGAYMAALSDTARADRDYFPVRNLYSVDGVDQDWHYWRHGPLAFLWEAPAAMPPLPDRQKMIAGARPGWQFLLRRFLEGPTLSGNVFDRATGKPLEAVVSLDEIQTFEKEVHTSNPATGRFDRVLPAEGTYHLRVEKKGYRGELFEVHLGREWKRLWIGLSPEG
jgi:hypothetical protein